jgi:hypothetical protein
MGAFSLSRSGGDSNLRQHIFAGGGDGGDQHRVKGTKRRPSQSRNCAQAASMIWKQSSSILTFGCG